MTTLPIEQKLHIKRAQLHAYSTGLLQGTAYQRLYETLVRALLPYSLSIPEWKLLGQLHEHGSMRLTELADYLNYDPPMVTKVSKLLEKKELAKRSHDKIDERAKIIIITSKGSKLIDEVELPVKKAMAGILTGITPHELSIYIKVLLTIVNNTQS